MRRVLACAALVAALIASAATVGADDRKRPADRNFWGWLLDPHGVELTVILHHARENLRRADEEFLAHGLMGFDAGQATNRRALLEDTVGMLRHGLALDPDNAALLRQLGHAADELGAAGVARDALERYLAAELPRDVQGDSRLRLARILALEGHRAQAIGELRRSLGSRWDDDANRVQAIVALACLYMDAHRIREAIDLLAAHVTILPSTSFHYAPAIVFALAVAYDRDEQLTVALDTLRDLTTTSEDSLRGALLDSRSQPIRFVPPADRHYFAALQYEALGHYPEARSEWLSYIASGEAPYARRARAHVRALERLMDAAPAPTGDGGVP